MTDKTLSRRVVLTGAATTGVIGASTLLLTACSSGGGETGSAASVAPSAAAGSASAPGEQAVSPSTGASASGAEITRLADVPVGQATSVTFEGQQLVVAQPTAGSVVAFSSVCPHQGCAVAFAKKEFACPCHGSTFDLATGDVTHGPARTGLTPVPVTVSGDAIVAA